MRRTSIIPDDLKPADGRFGCGPSKVRPEQLDGLRPPCTACTSWAPSHRQKPVKAVVGRVRAGLAELFSLPEGYEVMLGNGGTTAFWDAAAAGLVREQALHLSFGEFSNKFAHRHQGRAVPRRTRSSSRPSPATRPAPQPDPAPTSSPGPTTRPRTGVMARRRAARTATRSSSSTRPPAPAASRSTRPRPTSTTSPRRSASPPTAASGSRCSAPPRRSASPRSARRTDRWIPESLSLTTALDNSKKDQTYNTPAVATLLMLADQVEWMNANGGLELHASAAPPRARTRSTAGPRRAATRRRSSQDPAQALARRRHDRLRRGGRRRRGRRDPARQRHRRHRALPQARPQPAAHRHVPGDRPGRRPGAHRRASTTSWRPSHDPGPRRREHRRLRHRPAQGALRRHRQDRLGRRRARRGASASTTAS